MNMRVNSTYNAYQIFNTNSPGRARRINDASYNGRDTFTLSVQAEDYQQARRAVSRVPDVRAEEMDRIRSQIESGLYSVNASAVADKILQNFNSIY